MQIVTLNNNTSHMPQLEKWHYKFYRRIKLNSGYPESTKVEILAKLTDIRHVRSPCFIAFPYYTTVTSFFLYPPTQVSY
jgi:hypothetical protein